MRFARDFQTGSREKLQNGLFDLLPGSGAWIDQIEVPRSGDFQKVHVFSIFAGALLLRRDIVAAEGNGNYVVSDAVNEPLPALRNRKLHGIRFAIVVGDLGGRPVEEFDDGIIAEMEPIGTPQVGYSGQRDYAR